MGLPEPHSHHRSLSHPPKHPPAPPPPLPALSSSRSTSSPAPPGRRRSRGTVLLRPRSLLIWNRTDTLTISPLFPALFAAGNDRTDHLRELLRRLPRRRRTTALRRLPPPPPERRLRPEHSGTTRVASRA